MKGLWVCVAILGIILQYWSLSQYEEGSGRHYLRRPSLYAATIMIIGGALGLIYSR